MSVSILPPRPLSSTAKNPKGFRTQIRRFLEMIQFEHTLFALPFAYAGALLAGEGRLPFPKFIWITLAMAGARTAGMSLNRIIDRYYDEWNPRTENRALPQKLIRVKTVWLVVIASLALFVYSSASLNRLCLYLSPLAILILWGYSYLKRFTWLCHLGLGIVLACAPVGGFLAVSGRFTMTPIVLGTAMLFWLAGFDILYGCLDIEFDKKFGLHSIPQRFGIGKALWISSLFHLITFVCLSWTGILASLGWPYGIGLVLVALLLIYEHAIVMPHDLSRVNQAFFQANAAISLVVFAAIVVSYWTKP